MRDAHHDVASLKFSIAETLVQALPLRVTARVDPRGMDNDIDRLDRHYVLGFCARLTPHMHLKRARLTAPACLDRRQGHDHLDGGAFVCLPGVTKIVQTRSAAQPGLALRLHPILAQTPGWYDAMHHAD